MVKLSIISANAKREMDKSIKIAEEIKIIAELKEEWVAQIFNTLKRDIENSVDRISHVFKFEEFSAPKDIFNKKDILRECCEITTQLLEQAGYKTGFHEYSNSWQKQSGEFCYIVVQWN